MSVVSCSTTSTTAYKVTADTTGTLVFQTGATPTTAMTLSSAQVVTFANPPTATGGGSVSTNTAYGTSALAANTSGASGVAIGNSALLNNTTASYNTAVGYQASYTSTTASGVTSIGYQANYNMTTGGTTYSTAVGYRAAYGGAGSANYFDVAVGAFALTSVTSGAQNVAVGHSALYSNTTGPYNTAVGYEAAYSNTAGGYNTALGYQAGKYFTGGGNALIGSRTLGSSVTPCTGNYNTIVGDSAGYVLQGTASSNTFIGNSSGELISSGNRNTIIGTFSGNSGGLDIRTASNNIVLSDGAGNPRAYFQYTSSTLGFWTITSLATKNSTNNVFQIANAGGVDVIFEAGNNDPVGISGVMRIAKQTGNSRSINAQGTVNQNGADYAEYMVKSGDFIVAKGDVVGINAQGKLTNVFDDAISFCVKSTDPGLVGGDKWFTEPRPKDENNNELTSDTQEYAAWFSRMEAARATVDRIAFCGQVPVNVTGTTAGQYIIPVNDNGAIKGEAVSNPTFEQYQQAVGKVIAIEQDGRAKIIVKVA